ncbi:MAG: ATP-binding protein [Dehalococcoidales bacterium]|nr:ATP-binding protein [Dehalococcoidales bacterium]
MSRQFKGSHPILQEFVLRCKNFADLLYDEVLILDRDYNVIMANQALLHNKGWAADEVAGRRCHEVSHGSSEPCQSPNTPCPLVEALASGSRSRVTHIHRDKQGKECFEDIAASPISDENGNVVGIIELMRDITEEVELRKALEQRNADLATLNSIIVAGGKGLTEEKLLTYALDQILENTGMDAGWILLREENSRSLRCIKRLGVSEEFIKAILSLPTDKTLCGLAATKGQVAMVDNLSQDPRVTHPTITHEGLRAFMCVPLRADSKLLGSISVAGRDPASPQASRLQQLVAIGDQLGIIVASVRLNSSLRQYALELEEARRRREQSASVVSHELKGVLSVLSGYTQLLRKRLESQLPQADLGKGLEIINAQTNRLNRLVDDMRDVSAIESGRLTLVKARCDVVGLSRDVIQGQQALTQKHILLLDSSEEHVEGEWDCDRIRQVIDNLVNNAIKYSPNGGEVKVSIERRKDEVLVSVKDQGLGIAQKELRHLFHPYARVHKEIKGLGLGLFICSGIIKSHGGRVWVESQEGKGSTFYFTLPLR